MFARLVFGVNEFTQIWWTGGADIPPALAGLDEALAAFKCELGFSPPVPLTPPGWGGPAADWLFGAPIGSAGALVGSE